MGPQQRPQVHKGCQIPLPIIGRERGASNAKHRGRCLDLGIKVSTAIDTRSLRGVPPSIGSFTEIFQIFIAPVIDFLVSKKSPLLVNIDTYFIYANNMRDVSSEYALLTSYKNVVNDGQTYIETSSSHSWTLSTRHWRN